MLPEKDAIRAQHMLDAARQAIAFAEGRSRADLDTDQQLEFAITHAIQIIGEAAAQVSEAGRALCPTVPWRQIVGTRHHLVHAYWDVNRDRLWETLTENLPPLIRQLEVVVEQPREEDTD
jgi:uncharacterized protein with HEPN domain